MGERRVWWHWQNLNDKPVGRQGSGLVHGRAWLHVGALGFGVEWSLWWWSSLFADVDLGDGDHDASCSIGVPPLGLWFHLGGLSRLRGFRWLRRFHDYEAARGFALSLHSWSIFWRCWADDMAGYSFREPWWKRRRGSISLDRLIFGRNRCERRVIRTGPVLIPMPEGNYHGTFKTEEFVWTWPRWFTRRRVDTWIDVDGERHRGGVPFPGKGENSWDCGMDGLYGAGCAGESAERAVGHFVGSVLVSRRRYGGQGWTPKVDEHTAEVR